MIYPMKRATDVQSKLCYWLRYLPQEQHRYQRRFRPVDPWRLTEANCQGVEIETILDDICRLACVAGCVSHLIYHCDTKRFYIRLMDKIHALSRSWRKAPVNRSPFTITEPPPMRGSGLRQWSTGFKPA